MAGFVASMASSCGQDGKPVYAAYDRFLDRYAIPQADRRQLSEAMAEGIALHLKNRPGTGLTKYDCDTIADRVQQTIHRFETAHY
jgi:hypothetical protein